MKIFISLIAGIFIGGLAVFLYIYKSTNEKGTQNFSRLLSPSFNFLTLGSVSSPSTKISLDSALKLDSMYLDYNPIIFGYHDLAGNPHSNQQLKGFSVDVNALNSIIKQSSTSGATVFPSRVFLMLGLRNDTIQKNPYIIDKLTTTILVGLKQVVTPNATTHQNDTTYQYMPNDVWDYSNPCPPYCPGK